ncbi:MAG: A24 family peptidase [Planctomycetia bacterium]|nr:A24 family peptidase [Planctomycetia bacterium]
MMPPALRLALLFVLGAVVASFANLGIYRLAWRQQWLSPWGPAPPGAAPRGWLDRVPIFGWLRLRREAAIFGPGFWIRPLLIELATAAGFAALGWWEIDRAGLLTPLVQIARLPPGSLARPLTEMLLCEGLLAHLLLFSLLLVATFIDIDEKSIPDEITVSGAVLGLMLAAALPWSLLPAGQFGVVVPWPAVKVVEFLHIASPAPWPHELAAAPNGLSLLLGLACYEMWCFALLPRTWYGRHGIRRALGLCWARVAREPASRLIAALAVIGAVAIAGVWWRGEANWAALLTALVGLAVGGGIVWAVRLIGYAVLRREAMGFGDVTLLAMIGTFVGWQPCVLIFLFAPLAGVLIGVGQWLLRKEQEIPYGPFLCLATVAVIVGWAGVWTRAQVYFQTLGLAIPAIGAVGLVLMGILLWLIQLGKGVVRRLTAR